VKTHLDFKSFIAQLLLLNNHSHSLTPLGDGLCCAYGDGHVRVFLDDREILNAQSFRKMMSEVIKVGYDPTSAMTERDILYLEAHNTRRKEWHESNNVSYVPLVWSHQLAFEARIWAG
jgi:hypothetical protein